MKSKQEFDVIILLSGQPRTWRGILTEQIEKFKKLGSVAVICHFWIEDFEKDIIDCLQSLSGVVVFSVTENLPENTSKYYRTLSNIGRHAQNGAFMVHGMCSAYAHLQELNLKAKLIARSRYDVVIDGKNIDIGRSILISHPWANKNVFFDGFFAMQFEDAAGFYSNLLEQFLCDTLEYKVDPPEFVVSRLLSTNIKGGVNRELTATICRENSDENIKFGAKERGLIGIVKANLDTLRQLQRDDFRSLKSSIMIEYLFTSYLNFILLCFLDCSLRVKNVITRRLPTSL